MAVVAPVRSRLGSALSPFSFPSLSLSASIRFFSRLFSLCGYFVGVPSEYNEYLPKDSDEFKRWKASKEAESLSGDAAGLSLGEGKDAAGAAAAAAPGAPAAAPAASSSSKKKKGRANEVVLERATRNKKKAITTITGLDLFGVKNAEASKLFGKKFASGASVTKTAEGREQIDVQGDFVDQAAALIEKQWGDKVPKEAVFVIESKKKVPYHGREIIVD